LMSNAVKYGIDNGKIEISAQEKEDFVEIEFFNTGEPIEEKDAGRLFKKFSRIKSESSKNIKGTGLGLFISREILKKHNGDISLKPSGKGGNSFIFTVEKGL
ncbi:MAG: ATP-binding protein, partial [Candidatus Omnitrophota bacterium]